MKPKVRHTVFKASKNGALLGHSNEIHCFSSPASMLEWILGLELILVQVAAKTARIYTYMLVCSVCTGNYLSHG